MSSLQESDQGVLLLQLIFILISSSLMLKKMTSEGFAQSPLLSSFLPLQLSLSFRMKENSNLMQFYFLPLYFLISFKTYSRDLVNSLESCIIIPSSF